MKKRSLPSGAVYTGILLMLSPMSLFGQTRHLSQKVNLFKNGTAFIRESDSVKVTEGRTVLPLPPAALFGTLWLSSSTGSLVSVSTGEQASASSTDLNTLKEILTANTGKRVRIVMAYQDPVEGMIVRVVNDLVVFKTKDKWITTTVDKVETLEFLEEPKLTGTQRAAALVVNWKEGKAAQELTRTYMVNNTGWLPEYLVEMLDDQNARLVLRAKVVNGAQDLADADVNFVVGVPNFKYATSRDPLTSRESMESLLESLGDKGYGNPLSVLSNQALSNIGYGYGVASPASPAPADANTALGATTEDFFLYSLKRITLAHGERAAYTLLETKTPYKNLYSVEVPGNAPVFSTAEALGFAQPATLTVYHSIQLTNQTQQPWTTGAAFLLKNEAGQSQPLAQDILPYTPKGALCNIRLTAAPDILAKRTEQEVSRTDSKDPDGKMYTVATMEAQVILQNFKEKEVTLDVKREVRGQLLSSDLTWKVAKRAEMYLNDNPVNEIFWQLNLKPGEEKIITYRYTVKQRKG